MSKKEPHIKIETPIKGKAWKGKLVLLDWPNRKFPINFEIYVRTDNEKEIKEGILIITHYEVNWSAMGSQTPELARLFARALSVAAREAANLTKRYKGCQITGTGQCIRGRDYPI